MSSLHYIAASCFFVTSQAAQEISLGKFQRVRKFLNKSCRDLKFTKDEIQWTEGGIINLFIWKARTTDVKISYKDIYSIAEVEMNSNGKLTLEVSTKNREMIEFEFPENPQMTYNLRFLLSHIKFGVLSTLKDWSSVNIDEINSIIQEGKRLDTYWSLNGGERRHRLQILKSKTSVQFQNAEEGPWRECTPTTHPNLVQLKNDLFEEGGREQFTNVPGLAGGLVTKLRRKLEVNYRLFNTNEEWIEFNVSEMNNIMATSFCQKAQRIMTYDSFRRSGNVRSGELVQCFRDCDLLGWQAKGIQAAEWNLYRLHTEFGFLLTGRRRLRSNTPITRLMAEIQRLNDPHC